MPNLFIIQTLLGRPLRFTCIILVMSTSAFHQNGGFKPTPLVSIILLDLSQLGSLGGGETLT